MTAVFVDTSYFVALIESRDEFHSTALELSGAMRRPLLTTSAILLEVGARYAKSPLRPMFARIVDELQTLGAEILHVDASLPRRGIELFRSRNDKDWSLTDCISFIVMQDRGIEQAASADEHFEQAGFVALLRSPRNTH